MPIRYLAVLILSILAIILGVQSSDETATPEATSPSLVASSTRATTTRSITAASTSTLATNADSSQTPTTTKSNKIALQATSSKPLVTPTPPTIVKPATQLVISESAAQTPPPPASDLNTSARNALVNIFCEADPLSLLPSTIGSGMIIDPRGIILTNAHVAENLLLESYRVPNAIQCYARNGSPARIAYKLKLLYLPPSWVSENASHISAPPGPRTGLGKHDFALLYIVASGTDTPLPPSFPFVPLEYMDTVDIGEEVFAVAYPAELLPERNKLNALYPVSAYSKVEYYITFTKDILDEIYLSGNAVSQTGASGGGVMTTSGTLYAVITTVTDGATPQDRDFQAITIPYISREFEAHTGETLQSFLNKDPRVELANFRDTVAPQLTATFVAEYQKVHGQ